MSTYTKNSLNAIWRETLDNIKSGGFVDASVFDQVFLDSQLYDINDEYAVIVAPNYLSQCVLNMDENKSIIQNKLSEITQKNIKVKALLKNEIQEVDLPISHLSEANKKIILQDKLLDKYTFDNFVVGHSNRESQAAALSCAVNQSSYFNPLFIYGNSGLGKTHLLHAIGNYVKQHSPEKKVLYIYSEDFIGLIVNALRDNTIDEVKRIIEETDYLLIDDIQRLKQGERSQEIFFNIYNNLYNKGKQIVFTSDIHPSELKGIENRLVSRFTSGLSVGIDSPEFETSLAILEKKIEERGESLLIEKAVLEYIATTYSTDVRELEGNLNKLIFKAILYNPKVIDLDFAIQAFKDEQSSKSGGALTVTKIKRAVCDFYGLTRAQLESKSKTSNISNARHIAIYLCRTHLDLPFAKIGAEFGGRDHSTVMSSYDKMCKYIKENELFATAVSKIEKKLGLK